MTRSYTEDEWMGVGPVYSPAIRDEPEAFDWDAYEREQQRKEALEWVEETRKTIFPPLFCCVCGEATGQTLIASEDDPDLKTRIARANKTSYCFRHERKK